jgi:hypothetical protein
MKNLLPAYIAKLSVILQLLFLLCPLISSAETIGYCDDYFRTNWNQRLSMTDRDSGVLQDIPALQLGTTGTLSYGSGVLSFTSTGSSPRFALLTPAVEGSLPVGTRYGDRQPIDTSLYRYLVVRMYSSEDATAQIRWTHTISRYALSTFIVKKGWHTYTIDLPNAAIASSVGADPAWNAGTVIGLDLIPVNKTNTTVQVDFIQLSATGCGTYDTTFTTGDATTRKIVVADTDSNYMNGTVARTSSSTGSNFSINKHELFPGTYSLYGVQSADWGVLERGNAYDMDSSEVDKDVDLDLPIAFISNYGFTGSAFVGTTTGSGDTSDASFYLKMPTGGTFDSSVYRYVTVGLTFTTVPVSPIFGQVHFFDSNNNIATYGFSANAGTAIKQIDVNALTKPSGWTGLIRTIRVDPSDNVGTSFALNFVSINQTGYVTEDQTATAVPLSTLEVADLQLGMVRPDKAGGRDYAQTVLNNSWNMNSASEFVNVFNATSALIYPHGSLTDEEGNAVIGDLFIAQNVPANGDANYYSILQNGLIDTNEYVNICFRAWNDTEAEGYNSVARILWQDPRLLAIGQNPSRNGDDIVMRRGVGTYCFDFRTFVDSQIEPPISISDPNPWTSIGASGNFVNFFRIDLNENEENSFYSAFDYITLRADHESHTQYAIVVDAPMTQAVSLYYNTTQATTGGTLITTLTTSRDTNVHKWDTSALAAGTYYVYATSTANGNTISRLAEGRVKVSHSITQDTTAPVLVCERPSQGDSFSTSLDFAGYALDETRIATVEAQYSSDSGSTYTYLTTLPTDRYHVDAQAAYPTYAESNNPGFYKTVSTASLSNGSYVFRIVATDTAGNQTSCTKTLTRSPGGTPTAITYPTPSAATVSVPIGVLPTPTPTPTPATGNPGLAVKITSKTKDQLTFTFTAASSCTSGTVYAQTTTALLSSKPTVLGTISSTAKATKLPKVTDKKPGKVYFKVTCADARSSSVVSIDLKKLGSSKSKKTTAKKIVAAIKKAYK